MHNHFLGLAMLNSWIDHCRTGVGRNFLRVLLIILMLSPISAVAQKTDVIKFKNGDTLTVDIKQFERGLLRATTNGVGTIFVEWEAIDSISTDKQYRIELDSGATMLGLIQPAENAETLIVRTGSNS